MSPRMAPMNGTILQYFHGFLPVDLKFWSELCDRIPAISRAGFSAVWLPPAYTVSQQDGLDDCLPDVWLRRGHDASGPRGALLQYSTGGRLASTVEQLQAKGIQVYADIVFHGEAGILRGQLQEWSCWFLEVTGVDGFRLDAAIDLTFDTINRWLYSLSQYESHLPSPTERQSCSENSSAQTPTVQKSTTQDIDDCKLFHFGEYWLGDAGPLQWFLEELDNRLALLDVPLHYNFHHASRSGQDYDLSQILAGSLVQQCPLQAITFVDNHHSQPLEIYDSVVEAWFKPLAYALILLRKDGYPSVFYADYYGAQYEGIGGDGLLYSIVLDSHQWILNQLMQLRRQSAYGDQKDYFDDRNVVGWTRLGNSEHPRAIAVLMSNGTSGSKWMYVNRANAQFRDALGHVSQTVVTDVWGWGEFLCQGRSVSVWVEQ